MILETTSGKKIHTVKYGKPIERNIILEKREKENNPENYVFCSRD